MKSEALARYPGVIADSNLLLSAGNGNGTFSPVVVDLRKQSMHALAPIQSIALIPFWIMVPVEDAGSTKYTLSGGYAVVTGNGTEFRLWNTTTMSMAEPFAASPDYACSIATHMKDANTQELYVLSTGDIHTYLDTCKQDIREIIPCFLLDYAQHGRTVK